MIGRLDPQKGFDLLAEAAPRLLASGARLIVQGSGDPALAEPFRALAGGAPDQSSSTSASTGRWPAGSTPAPTCS